MSTPFSTANMPGGIYACQTVEEVVVWGNLVLEFNNPTNKYTEADNTNPLFHHINPQIRIPAGNLIRVCRSAIIMNDAAAQNMPVWKRVTGLSGTTAIADAFKITAS